MKNIHFGKEPPAGNAPAVCSNCGLETDADDLYCSECGSTVGVEIPDKTESGVLEETRWDAIKEPHTCSGCARTIRPEDEFCSECGPASTDNARAKENYFPPEKTEPVRESLDFNYGTDYELDKKIEGAGDSFLEKIENASREIGKAIHSVSAEHPVKEAIEKLKGGCPDLQIEYNANAVFLQGNSCPFLFRVKPLSKNIESISIYIDAEEVITAPLCVETEEELESGVEIDNICINFKPVGAQGRIGFKLYFSYEKDGEEFWYIERKDHWIFPADESIGKVAETLNLKIENIAKDVADQGGVSVNLNELIRRPAENLIAVLQNYEPRWEELNLRKCRKKPVRVSKLASLPKHFLSGISSSPPSIKKLKITLFHGNFRTHLISGNTLKLGKNRRWNDIVARNLDPEERWTIDELKRRNKPISRGHCEIIYEGSCISIRNGQDYPGEGLHEPAAGTFLQNKRITGKKQLPANCDFELSLGGVSGRGGFGVLAFNCRVYTYDALMEHCHGFAFNPDDPVCMVLNRVDDIPEKYVLIFRLCSLKDIFPGYQGDGCVYMDTDNLGMLVEGETRSLLPGRDILINGKTIEISTYRQFGL